MDSGEANRFGADERPDSLCVFAETENPTLAHYNCVDGSVHLSIDKGDVIKQVNTPLSDRFDWSWATAEDS